MRGHEFVANEVHLCCGCGQSSYCKICFHCLTPDCGAYDPHTALIGSVSNLARGEEPHSYPDDNPKTEFGLKKPPLNLIPPIALVEESKAFGNGAEKYGPFNWREKTVSVSIYVAAAMRHLLAYWDGEDLAQDSKVHHLAHARACLAILLDAGSLGKLNDDRPPKGRNGL